MKTTNIYRILSMVSKRDRILLGIQTITQILLNVLDLIGVALIGIVGALSVNGISSKTPGTRVSSFLEFVNLENFTLQKQVAILGAVAVSLLVTKTLVSLFLMKRTLYFLGRKCSDISKKAIQSLLSMPLLEIQKLSNQDVIFKVTTGVNALILSVLGLSIALIADFSLFIILLVALVVINPAIALTSGLFFSAIVLILYRAMHNQAQQIGEKERLYSIEENEKLIEVLSSYRESVIKNRRPFYADYVGQIQQKKSRTQADRTLMPNISKYVVESALLLGTLGITAFQFIMQDAFHAIATLSIFLAAGSRIAPAALRIQQGLLQIKTGIGTGLPTINFVKYLENFPFNSSNMVAFNNTHAQFEPIVKVENLNLKYESSGFSLKNISLEINQGESVAIVGASGSGKTTLVDIILGLINPDSGSVTISGETPQRAIQKWDGAIAYVPQDVFVINKTIRENLTLGYDSKSVPDNSITFALDTASLNDFVNSLPNGVSTEVGERGASLSGGQRQRLGIARALITDPHLLVLDEATSALDGETELRIAESINKLKGKCTVIMIAHRLSSIRNADKVIYMDGGRILAIGTFVQVRAQVPDFDKQAGIMGL
jgi:ABC-type multidrug transport system fused ATPase/permease subunit